MTDIVERAWKLIEDDEQVTTAFELLTDEVKRLREQVASLQASSGYEASIAQLQIERLREALQLIIDDTYDQWAKTIARRALEPKT